jgi:hypothetical protein
MRLREMWTQPGRSMVSGPVAARVRKANLRTALAEPNISIEK